MLSACSEKGDDRLRHIEEFSEINNENYSINTKAIYKNIANLIKTEGVSLASDRHVIKYYSENKLMTNDKI